MPRSKIGVALTQERLTTHGPFDDVARTFARLLAVVNQMPNWPLLSPTKQMALTEIFHKVSRIGHGNSEHADHWNDIAGYGELGGRNCAPKTTTSLKRARKARKPAAKKAKKPAPVSLRRAKKTPAKKAKSARRSRTGVERRTARSVARRPRPASKPAAPRPTALVGGHE